MIGAVIGFVILFLSAVGIAAFILWIRDHDQGGPLSVGIEKTLMAVIGTVGLMLGVRLIHSWILEPSKIADDILTVLSVLGPVWWVPVGWRALADPGLGIENQKVDFRSPELIEARKKAKSTLPYFIEQTRQHIDDAYIRFPLETDEKATEHVWAYVHHYQDGIFNASPEKKPSSCTQDGEFGKRRDVPESAVEDWRIMQVDGRIKGAYSYIAAFRYVERKGTRLNRTMRRQKAQLVDAVPVSL